MYKVEKKPKKERPLYQVSYRHPGGFLMVCPPMFNKKAADKIVLFYENLYGPQNVYADIIDKWGRIRRPEETYEEEPDWSEE